MRKLGLAGVFPPFATGRNLLASRMRSLWWMMVPVTPQPRLPNSRARRWFAWSTGRLRPLAILARSRLTVTFYFLWTPTHWRAPRPFNRLLAAFAVARWAVVVCPGSRDGYLGGAD